MNLFFFFLIFFTPDSSLASFSLTHCTAFWMTIKREGHTSSQLPSEIIQLAMLVLNSRNFQFNKFRATIVRCKRIRMHEKRNNVTKIHERLLIIYRDEFFGRKGIFRQRKFSVQKYHLRVVTLLCESFPWR